MKSESEVTQSCPTLHDPMDYSPPGSSIHEIFQARVTGVGCHCLLQCSRFKLYSVISIVLILILKPTISRIFKIILDAWLYLIWDILRWTQQSGSPIIADVTLLFNAHLRQSLPIGWKPLADWGMPCSLLSPVQLCDSMDCSTPGSSVLRYLPVCSNLGPLSWWCHPTISSSVVPFSSCLQSFPASGFFQWASSLHQMAKV